MPEKTDCAAPSVPLDPPDRQADHEQAAAPPIEEKAAPLSACDYRLEFHDWGGVVIRNFLSVDEQIEVLNTSFAMRDPRTIHMNPNSLYTPLFTWNWPGNKMGDYQNEQKQREEPQFFDRVLNMGERAVQAVYRHLEANPGELKPQADARYVLPSEFTPRALRGILYPSEGRLHAHQDLLMGWVLGLSLGASCDFFWGPHWEIDDDRTRVVTLASGDFILINGQALHHGVCTVMDETAPEWWTSRQRNGDIPEQWFRFNMQFRDPARIR